MRFAPHALRPFRTRQKYESGRKQRWVGPTCDAFGTEGTRQDAAGRPPSGQADGLATDHRNRKQHAPRDSGGPGPETRIPGAMLAESRSPAAKAEPSSMLTRETGKRTPKRSQAPRSDRSTRHAEGDRRKATGAATIPVHTAPLLNACTTQRLSLSRSTKGRAPKRCRNCYAFRRTA